MQRLLFILILFNIQACTSSESNPKPANTILEQDSLSQDTAQQFVVKDTIHTHSIEDKKGKISSVQTFFIDQNKNNILQGREGSILVIPKNCFVDQTGKLVTQKINIKLIEAYSLADIIHHNLTTQTSSKLLITGGMLNIRASSINGQDLDIAAGKAIELVVATDQQEFKLFDFNGKTWENPQTQSPYLSYKAIQSIKPAPCKMMGKTLKTTLANAIRSLPDSIQPIVHKSYLASQEFEERFYWVGCHEGSTLAKKIYLNNLSKPLWKVDSMVVEQFKKHPNSYSDQIISKFITFQKQYKTTLNPDLHLSESDLQKLQSYERILQKEQEKYRKKLIAKFRLNKLGWKNIDRYYQQPLRPTDLIVTSEQDIQKLFLVLKDEKVVINGLSHSPTQYTVKKELPHVPAYLIAITENKGQLFLAKKEIQIGQQKEEHLVLKASNPSQLEQLFNTLDKEYVD